MVDYLVNIDVNLIKVAFFNNEYSYLDSILRGDEWIQYNNLTDKQIEDEYNEEIQ